MDASRLEQFLREKCLPDLHKSVSEEKAVVIDFSVFDRLCPAEADSLLEDPDSVL